MEAYRDQYATLFNNGKKVVVIGISTDADTTQANWARESSFPNLFACDPDQAVAKLYGSADGKADTRNVFIIAPDGKISARIMKFNVLSETAYSDLGKAVAKAAKASTASSSPLIDTSLAAQNAAQEKPVTTPTDRWRNRCL